MNNFARTSPKNARGTLTGTEDQVFKAIKTLAIREENTMVARASLHNMRQDRDEPGVPSGPG